MPLQTQTFQEFQTLLATQYSSQAALPANTNPGSSLGAIFNAAALMALVLQNELVYIDQISRLSTIPANPDGSPNPDVDTFVNPFGVFRIQANASSGYVTCSVPSPVTSPLLIPVGGIFQTQGGLQFIVIAGGTGYNVSANGYYIGTGQTSVSVLVQCVAAGSIGNVAANTITVVFGSSTSVPVPAVTVTNPSSFTNGVNVETDAQLKTRFTLLVSTGRVATNNAILGTILGVQAGLTASLGDRVNPDLSEHDAYFTVFVAVANSGQQPTNILVDAVENAIDGVRSAGISFEVDKPTLVPLAFSGKVIPNVGFTTTQALNDAIAAATAFANGINLNPDTTSTSCAFLRAGAALISPNVPSVFEIQNLQINGGTADLTAAFGYMFAFGSQSFTT